MATRVPEESLDDQYREERQLEEEVAKLRAELVCCLLLSLI